MAKILRYGKAAEASVPTPASGDIAEFFNTDRGNYKSIKASDGVVYPNFFQETERVFHGEKVKRTRKETVSAGAALSGSVFKQIAVTAGTIARFVRFGGTNIYNIPDVVEVPAGTATLGDLPSSGNSRLDALVWNTTSEELEIVESVEFTTGDPDVYPVVAFDQVPISYYRIPSTAATNANITPVTLAPGGLQVSFDIQIIEEPDDVRVARGIYSVFTGASVIAYHAETFIDGGNGTLSIREFTPNGLYIKEYAFDPADMLAVATETRYLEFTNNGLTMREGGQTAKLAIDAANFPISTGLNLDLYAERTGAHFEFDLGTDNDVLLEEIWEDGLTRPIVKLTCDNPTQDVETMAINSSWPVGLEVTLTPVQTKTVTLVSTAIGDLSANGQFLLPQGDFTMVGNNFDFIKLRLWQVGSYKVWVAVDFKQF